jgi:hypothetical protein
MSFAELYPPLAKGALLGAIADAKWRRLWDMASADSFAMTGPVVVAAMRVGNVVNSEQAVIN